MSPRLVRSCALAALLLSACTVLDTRDEIRIEPEGTLHADMTVALTVRGKFDRFRVAVDGETLEGTFPTGQPVKVVVDGVDPGRHTFEVRAIDAALPLRATRELMIERGPLELLGLTPVERVVTSGVPPVIEATFSFPIAPPPATEVTVTSSSGAGIPATVTVLPGGLTLRIALGAPLDLFGTATVKVQATALRGIGGRFDLGTWSTPALALALDAPVSDLDTNGAVTITVRGDGTALPAPLEVWAGSQRIASLDAPPWQLSWDTRGVAEGSYPLSLRVRGRYVPGPFPTVTVDRTAPSATCVPLHSAQGALWVGECVVVSPSERLPTAPLMLVNGAPRAVQVLGASSTRLQPLYLCPVDTRLSPPARLEIVLPADPAGNVPAGSACAFDVPVWRAPLGTGAAVLAGSVLRASEISFDAYTPFYPGATVVPTPRAMVPWAADGRISAAGWVTGAWTWTGGPSLTLQGAAAGGPTVGGSERMAWTETSSSETAVCTSRYWNGVWTYPDCRRGSRSPAFSPDGVLLVRSAENVSGGRDLIVARAEPGFISIRDVGRVLSDPTSTTDHPAVSNNPPAEPLIAWLETSAGGGPAQLRAALGDLTGTTWTALDASLSADPALPASEPAVYAMGAERVLAWVEGGRVLARRWSGAAFGAPEVLTSPGSTGRTPRFVADPVEHPVIVFVETDGAGDHIRARRFDGLAWTPQPDPFEGATGGVVQLVANERGGVAWLDAAGEVRLRLYNR